MALALNDATLAWIAGKPGPFSGITPEDTWSQAYKNFEKGSTSNVRNMFHFMILVQAAGYDAVQTALGGFVLTGVP